MSWENYEQVTSIHWYSVRHKRKDGMLKCFTCTVSLIILLHKSNYRNPVNSSTHVELPTTVFCKPWVKWLDSVAWRFTRSPLLCVIRGNMTSFMYILFLRNLDFHYAVRYIVFHIICFRFGIGVIDMTIYIIKTFVFFRLFVVCTKVTCS